MPPGWWSRPASSTCTCICASPGSSTPKPSRAARAAAAAGGFTSICCMPNTEPVNDSATVTSYIVEKARRHAVVNVFPIGAITKGSAGEELAAIGSMRQAGAVAISDDGRPVMNARVMRRAMEFARSFGIPVINHCEDLHLSAGGDMHEGAESVRLGLRGIPGVLGRRDGGARYSAGRSDRGALSRGAHFVAALGGDGGVRQTQGTGGDRGSDAASSGAGRSRHETLRQQLQNEAAAAICERRQCGGRGGGQRGHRCHRHRPCAASGQRKDAGVREVPLRHPGLRNGAGPLAGTSGAYVRRSASSRLVELFTINPARILGIERGDACAGRARATSLFSRPNANGPTTSTSRFPRAATLHSTEPASAAARWPPSSPGRSSGRRKRSAARAARHSSQGQMRRKWSKE